MRKLSKEVIVLIRYEVGDIFCSNADCLINTVNCEGYMGKGIAYQFKCRFPENNKDYCNNLRTCYKFSEEVIDNFRMKARTIGCVVLHNLTNTDKVAVLVFESTDRKSKILTEKTMLAIYKEYKAEFQSIIDSLKDYIPLISVDNELEENQ